MPGIDSPYWNWQSGVCEKHHLPQVPCPQCLIRHDTDVEVRLIEIDQITLDFDPNLTLRDLLPVEDGDWLLERVVV